jgi:predicted metal-dependent HD superfamily phosphohydrolase
MLQQIFINHLSQFIDNQLLINKLWLSLEKLYGSEKRHYHTLKHIEHLFFLLEKNKNLIVDWDTLVISIFYHDVIYNARKSDNEEQSAIFMQKAMLEIAFLKEKIEKSYRQILATKKHEITGDNDTDLFTDADIAILGSDWETYQTYYQNIRKEYSIYPDFLYNNGRKKVLKHFLAMENIFKTPLFRSAFEEQARENLQNELKKLSYISLV